MKFIAPLLALASIASAHFTLDYPQTRGFNEDIEPSAYPASDPPSHPR